MPGRAEGRIRVEIAVNLQKSPRVPATAGIRAVGERPKLLKLMQRSDLCRERTDTAVAAGGRRTGTAMVRNGVAPHGLLFTGQRCDGSRHNAAPMRAKPQG